MSSSTKLYSPPTFPSSIINVALSSKTFRVFGLHTPAWQQAAQNSNSNNTNTTKRDEKTEIELITNAIVTALSDDAGGYGTAGFHVHKVEQVQQHENTAVYNAKLIPCDGKTNEPINPQSIYTLTDNESGDIQYMGNDKFYLNSSMNNNNEEGRFQIRITVSKASVGLAAKRYHEALYAKRHELDLEELDDVDSWVENDEELRELRQQLIDATNNNNVGTVNVEEQPMGYYIEMLLLEPHIQSRDVVIAPPVELDKSNPKRGNSSGSSSGASLSREEEHNLSSGIFTRDIYTSTTLTNPTIGIYEKLNIKVFTNIGLDVRKSLVRIEFPMFSEGCQDKTFREVYQLNARLKSGSFATVCRGTHRATGKKVAIKCVLRKDLPPGDDAAIYDEVLILSTLQHSYICPLIDFFEERECYFLIMELMSGGDLFDRIGSKKCYTEDDARSLCRKMLESVRYCHENSVAHCDMKPKNLLLVSDDDDVSIKLADFGFATRVYEPKSLTKQCGTPFFVAPEVLMRSPYDQQSDMWSVGVIMFLLLAGDLPFMGRTQKDLFRNIVMGKYEFEGDSWAHVSDQAKELVRQLLVTDPSRRLSSREALNSSWMRERGSMLAMNKLQYTSNRLAGFNARMKLRGSMLAVTSVARMRMSARSMVESGRSLENKSSTSVVPNKRSSFLDELPVEGENEEDN